jgi:gamma-aminobutyric acid type B receptor
VPQDRTIVRQVLRTVSLPLFICMWTISCVGIMAAIALIVFNIWYRHRRYFFLKIIVLCEIIRMQIFCYVCCIYRSGVVLLYYSDIG